MIELEPLIRLEAREDARSRCSTSLCSCLVNCRHFILTRVKSFVVSFILENGNEYGTSMDNFPFFLMDVFHSQSSIFHSQSSALIFF
jgi:hypothetical protein